MRTHVTHHECNSSSLFLHVHVCVHVRARELPLERGWCRFHARRSSTQKHLWGFNNLFALAWLQNGTRCRSIVAFHHDEVCVGGLSALVSKEGLSGFDDRETHLLAQPCSHLHRSQ